MDLTERAVATRYRTHQKVPRMITARARSGMSARTVGSKIGMAAERTKPRFTRAILNRLSQRSKKVFLIRNPIMGLLYVTSEDWSSTH